MRIGFNLLGTGLGNNGGSRTLIKCAEALQDLKHEVFLVTTANNYRWHKIKVPIVGRIPPLDVIIATGIGSVATTVKANVPQKFYYIRGYETWRVKEAQLFKSYRSLNCIVNSEWLQNHLASKGVHSHLIYPGIDDGDFFVEAEKKEDILGGIFSKRHQTKRHDDVIKVAKRLGVKLLLLNRDISSPTPAELRAFYNRIKVWLCPSELEGLHNCPMEAGLCGAGLVTTDHKRGGTSDYAIDKETCLVYPARNLQMAADKVQTLLFDDDLRERLNGAMRRLLADKIGTRSQNMAKMVQIFEA
jgi:glycosyltransferase involved in cell wall biosynthesis